MLSSNFLFKFHINMKISAIFEKIRTINNFRLEFDRIKATKNEFSIELW